MEKPDAEKPKHEPVLEDELGLDEPEQDTVQANVPDTQPDKLTDGLEKPKKTDLRPWYKRPKVWGIISGVTLLIVAVSVLGYGLRNRQLAQDYMTTDWRKLASSADRVASSSQQANYDSYGDVATSLSNMQDKLDDSSDQLAKIPRFMVDKAALNQYGANLEVLKTYVKQAKGMAGDLGAVTTSQLDDLKSQSTKTKLSVDDTKKNVNGLKEDFPEGFYTLNERMQTVIDAHKNLTTEEQAKEDAAKSAADQQKQNQADAEESASLWTQAFIAGNTTQMKQYMTAAFIKEYDFGQVSSTSRRYNYPTTYRRVNTDKKGEQYEIQEAVTFITKSDYSPDTTYTQNYILLMAQDSSSKKWLVNSQRYGQ